MKKFLVVVVALACSATAEAGFICGRPASPPCYQPPYCYPVIIIDCQPKPEKLKFEILEEGSGGSILPGAFGFSDMPPTGHPVSFLEPTGGLRHFYILDDEDRYTFWFGWGRKWFWRNLTYCDAPPIWCSEHPSPCHPCVKLDDPPCVTAVPEPSAVMLAIVGIGSLAAFVCLKSRQGRLQ